MLHAFDQNVPYILNNGYHSTKIWNCSKNPLTRVFSTPFTQTVVLDVIKGQIPLFLQKQYVHNYLMCFPSIYMWFKLLKISTI